MKRYALLLLALVGLASFGIYLAAMRPTTPRHAPAPVVQAAAPAATDLSRPVVPPARKETPVATSANPTAPSAVKIALITDPEAAKGRIQFLAMTYDAAQVPELAAYLVHPEARIRAEARLGLVTLSDAAAVPFLNDAAAKATLPAEALSLSEAAKFLARPKDAETAAAPRLSGRETIKGPVPADAAPTISEAQ